jgi:zinc and cadmium transporter
VPTLGWIIVAGLGMVMLALAGGLTVILPERVFQRLVLPLVSVAAGSLLGGALFHLLPAAVGATGNAVSVYAWVAAGVLAFLVLEQYLHWHHCHRPVTAHRPVGYLVLIADGVHNLIGGLAIGAAFVADLRLGAVTWLVAAAHEIPQELGDFGILVHSGWTKAHALTWNLASAATVLVGALTAYLMADRIDVMMLVPFAAGNFIYIALADLVPELTTLPAAHDKAIHTVGFATGLALLWAVAQLG